MTRQERTKTGRPNVVLIITDDQGYGDLGCHGNPVLKTPNLDRLHGESVRLTDFHVDPTCSPTRSALMTGRYASRTGVWHTITGRSLLRRDEITLAEVFAAAGYRTGIFGKWHLGDNYPYRPQDRGFQESARPRRRRHRPDAGRLGQRLLRRHLLHNGEPREADGLLHRRLLRGRRRSSSRRNRDRPVLLLPRHERPARPVHRRSTKYSQPYRDGGVPQPTAPLLRHDRQHRRERRPAAGQARRTGSSTRTRSSIFMTDNGTGRRRRRGRGAQCRHAGHEGFGVRRRPPRAVLPALSVPLDGRPRRDALTAHIDLLPTLLELCGIEAPTGVKLTEDLLPLFSRGCAAGGGVCHARPPHPGPPLARGRDQPRVRRATGVRLSCVSTGPAAVRSSVHSQRVETARSSGDSRAVMTGRIRLIDGKEFYFIRTRTPARRTTWPRQNSRAVKVARMQYEKWWEDIRDAVRRGAYRS